MSNPLLATLAVLATLAGCVPQQEHIYQDQPLVAQVKEGMIKQQVLDIAGQPAAQSNRTVNPGTCLDYQLTQSGQQQAYHVSLNATDKVDHKGFINCAGRERAEQAIKERSEHSGGGY